MQREVLGVLGLPAVDSQARDEMRAAAKILRKHAQCSYCFGEASAGRRTHCG